VRGVELAVPQEPDQLWLMHPPQLEADAGNAWLREQVEAVAR
jgi:hypothetical protein